jgi:protein arginine kinase activator
MICDFCKKNKADIHLIKIINNKVEKINLCKECIKNFNFLSEEDFINDLTKILSKVFEIDIKIYKDNESSSLFNLIDDKGNKKCSYCKIDLNTVKKIGRVGCPKCYEEFRENLYPIIKSIHGSLGHKGKIPFNSSNKIKIEMKIKDLEYKLKEEIIIENFEEAVKLRDNIKKLQKKIFIC